MHRRGFMIGCAAGAAFDAGALAQTISRAADSSPTGTPRSWPRALLVAADSQAVAARDVAERHTLLFQYSFVGTPAFLLNLGRPTRRSVSLVTEDHGAYSWHGGVGPVRSIVAFSAICAHRLAYPTRDISFIGFHANPSPVSGRSDVIHCCSEHSQYHPSQGARVLAGPATQPLAAILLEHDPASDRLYATGTQGGELFDRSFAQYPMQLSMDYGGRARDRSGGSCLVQPIEQYSRQLMRCG